MEEMIALGFQNFELVKVNPFFLAPLFFFLKNILIFLWFVTKYNLFFFHFQNILDCLLLLLLLRTSFFF